MNITSKTRVGELVANDYRTAMVFSKYGIDFCCKGGKSLSDACEEKKVNVVSLIEELDTCLESKNNGTSIDFKSWPLDLLIDYIVKKHHKYVEDTMPQINQFLNKLVAVHGKNHPELLKIRDEFTECTGELAMHMKKEELVLFPYVKKLVAATEKNQKTEKPNFGTVANPIEMMMHEHDVEGERFRRMRKLSSNYKIPKDACRTYIVTYELLNEFEDDLHMHIHLENNILFPKAILMEKGKNKNHA